MLICTHTLNDIQHVACLLLEFTSGLQTAGVQIARNAAFVKIVLADGTLGLSSMT